MRLINLFIKNINSFKGEFNIDFTKFENELFLISGDTGAGKTTIIDAITTALFDKTPRLNNTKYLLNEDCNLAEIILEFELKDHYKITWKAKRNKNINITRKLFKNGIEIADKKTQIKQEILNILKIDYEEFTKSIVLAQGEFDAFLSADSNQKAQVLEKLLNVKEYEIISKNIYEKTKQLKLEIQYLKDKLLDVDFGLIDKKKEELENLIDNLNKLNKEKQLLQKNISLQQQKQLLKTDIKEIQTKIDKYNQILKNLEDVEFEKFKKEYDKKIEFLDNKILLNERIINIQKNIDEINKNIAFSKQKLLSQTKELEKINKELQNIQIYEDPLLEKYDEIAKIYFEFVNLKKEYYNQYELKQNLLKQIDDFKEKLSHLKNKETILLEDLEYFKSQIFILKYEEDRKLLKPNQPCPLCGCTNHVYTQTPPIIKKDIKTKYDEISKNLETIQSQIEKLNQEILKNSTIAQNLNLEKIQNKLNELENKLPIKEEEFSILESKKQHNDKVIPQKNQLNIKLVSIQTNISNLNTTIIQDSKKLDQLYQELDQLKKDEYPNAINEKKDLQNEYNKLLQIHNKKINAQTMLESLNNELLQKQKKLEDIQIDDMDYKDKLAKNNKQTESISKQIGILQTQIQELINKQKEQETIISQIKEKNNDLRIYEKIDKVIGSATGDKFKKIAINYMIDSLLNVCNYHLDTLSNNRYVLVRNEDINKLDLCVIDRFYANKSRDVKTLSGGEKFLVSLALSFGLSDLVRNQVHIQTMFLDEGFGSLDKDSLYLALNTLKQISNKTIGIISHVEVLKEEISKQIKVIKQPNGTSKISIKG